MAGTTQSLPWGLAIDQGGDTTSVRRLLLQTMLQTRATFLATSLGD